MNTFDTEKIIPTAEEKLSFADLRRHRRVVLQSQVRELALKRFLGGDDASCVVNLRNALADLLDLETQIARHNRERLEARQ